MGSTVIEKLLKNANIWIVFLLFSLILIVSQSFNATEQKSYKNKTRIDFGQFCQKRKQ